MSALEFPSISGLLEVVRVGRKAVGNVQVGRRVPPKVKARLLELESAGIPIENIIDCAYVLAGYKGLTKAQMESSGDSITSLLSDVLYNGSEKLLSLYSPKEKKVRKRSD